MGFYIYMFICALILPACMLVLGQIWKSAPPGKINWAYGYRTRRSMASKAAWDFAHGFIGALLRRIGLIALAASAAVMLVLGTITMEMIPVAVAGVVLVVLQFIPFIASAVLTERALKEKFGN